MAVQVVIMAVVLAAQFWLLDASFGREMIHAMWLVYMEVLVVIAVALLFSSFSTPFLSGLLAFGIFATGRFADRLATLQLGDTKTPDPALERIAAVVRGLARVLPDLSLYNATEYVVHGRPLPDGFLLDASLYGLTYAGLALLLAAALFSRRDFV